MEEVSKVGYERGDGGGSGGTSGAVVLKYWQIVLILLVQLGGLAYGYGSMKQSVDDVVKRLDAEENKSLVNRDEFNDFRQEIRDDVKSLQLAITSERDYSRGK